MPLNALRGRSILTLWITVSETATTASSPNDSTTRRPSRPIVQHSWAARGCPPSAPRRLRNKRSTVAGAPGVRAGRPPSANRRLCRSDQDRRTVGATSTWQLCDPRPWSARARRTTHPDRSRHGRSRRRATRLRTRYGAGDIAASGDRAPNRPRRVRHASQRNGSFTASATTTDGVGSSNSRRRWVVGDRLRPYDHRSLSLREPRVGRRDV